MNGNDAPNASPAQAASVFVGIDISKRKFDAARLRGGKTRNKVFDNNAAGFQALDSWLRDDGVSPQQAHLCLEATGPYSEALATSTLSRRRAAVALSLFFKLP